MIYAPLQVRTIASFGLKQESILMKFCKFDGPRNPEFTAVAKILQALERGSLWQAMDESDL